MVEVFQSEVVLLFPLICFSLSRAKQSNLVSMSNQTEMKSIDHIRVHALIESNQRRLEVCSGPVRVARIAERPIVNYSFEKDWSSSSLRSNVSSSSALFEDSLHSLSSLTMNREERLTQFLSCWFLLLIVGFSFLICFRSNTGRIMNILIFSKSCNIRLNFFSCAGCRVCDSLRKYLNLPTRIFSRFRWKLNLSMILFGH